MYLFTGSSSFLVHSRPPRPPFTELSPCASLMSSSFVFFLPRSLLFVPRFSSLLASTNPIQVRLLFAVPPLRALFHPCPSIHSLTFSMPSPRENSSTGSIHTPFSSPSREFFYMEVFPFFFLGLLQAQTLFFLVYLSLFFPSREC